MAIEIKVPAAGESITSANIAKWYKSNGDSVKKGEPLVSLETDKVSNELEAEADGILTITVGEGEEVAIGTVIGKLEYPPPRLPRPPQHPPLPAHPSRSKFPPQVNPSPPPTSPPGARKTATTLRKARSSFPSKPTRSLTTSKPPFPALSTSSPPKAKKSPSAR